MPTVPSQNVSLSGRGARVSAGSIAQPQLPRNSTLLNARVAGRVNSVGRPDAPGPVGVDFSESQALLQVANQVHSINQQIQADVDEAVVKEADNKLSDAIRLSMMDPESGYMTTVGKSALAGREPTLNSIHKSRKEIEKILQNDRQKALFRQAAGARIGSTQDKIDNHSLQQVKVYKAAESKARITASKTDAVANWGGWNQSDKDGKPLGPYHLHKQTMMVEVEQQVRNLGFTPGSKEYRDAVQTAVLDQTTDLHAQVVQNMISFGQSGEAKEYFQKAISDGEVNPAQLDQINDLIKTGSVKEDSLELMFQLQGTESDRMKTLDGLFKQNKISAEVYDATATRVNRMEQQRKGQESEFKKNIMIEAEKWMIENPASTWVDMPAGLQQGLKNTGQLDTAISFSKNGGFDHNMDDWMAFLSLPDSERQAMSPTELYNTYRDKFDDAHMEKAAAMIMKPSSDRDPARMAIVSTQERVTRAAKDSGIIPFGKKPNEAQQQSYARFENAVQDKVNEYQDLNGKKPDGDQLQSIIDSVMTDKVYIPSLGFDSEESVFTIDPEKLSRAYVEVDGKEVKLGSIPPNKMAEYTQMLIDRGLPVTQQTIAEMWTIENN